VSPKTAKKKTAKTARSSGTSKKKKSPATKKKAAPARKAAAKKKTAAAGKSRKVVKKKTATGKKKSATVVSRKKVTKKAAAGKKPATTKKTTARKTGKPTGRIAPAGGSMRTRTEPAAIPPRRSAGSYKVALKVYAEAMALVQKKAWKEAAALLADFISHHGRERELCQRARTYLRVCSSHMNESHETLERVEDFCLLATVRSNDGKQKEALELLELALERKPEDSRALYLKASTLALMGDRRAALSTLDRSIQVDEQNRIYAANSPDFADLRDDEEFITMTTREDEEY
jgi:tetratricopeptide (TPR) repeat protein